MVKQILTVIGISTILSSCTVFKSLNPSSSKPLPVTATTTDVASTKFIENISVTAELEKIGRAHV